jgi:hypothetical protein
VSCAVSCRSCGDAAFSGSALYGASDRQTALGTLDSMPVRKGPVTAHFVNRDMTQRLVAPPLDFGGTPSMVSSSPQEKPMDTTASSFTARNNAKRAAEKMIANGRARRSITAFGPAMMGGLRSSGRPLRALVKPKPRSPRRRLRLRTALTRSSRSTRIRAMRHPMPGLRRPLLPLAMSAQRRVCRRPARPGGTTNGPTALA